MRKIKTVWKINRETHLATDEVVEAWVLNGEGRATIKFDGTSSMVLDGVLYKRYDAKHGKNPPSNWISCEEAPDPVTGHWPGWVPVDASDNSNRYHVEAFNKGSFPDGTYELIGPKVAGNPYGLTSHELVRHGAEEVEVGRTREEIVEWLRDHNHEGLVFHPPDGRMAKIRRKDFGFRWK